MATKLENLKISLARYAVLFGTRARTASKGELERLSFALLLLNQAQAVAEVSDNEARKLLALARNIANTGAQDESKKTRTGKRNTNEHREKNPVR